MLRAGSPAGQIGDKSTGYLQLGRGQAAQRSQAGVAGAKVVDGDMQAGAAQPLEGFASFDHPQADGGVEAAARWA